MKIYKGYELLKAIAEGEIKDNSKIKVSFNTTVIDIIEYKNGRLDWKQGGNFNTEYLCRNSVEFELIEDEIDIDSIEKIDITTVLDSFIDTENQIRDVKIQQNKILKAIKQLDKEVKELKLLNIEVSEKDINEAIKKARTQLMEDK